MVREARRQQTVDFLFSRRHSIIMNNDTCFNSNTGHMSVEYYKKKEAITYGCLNGTLNQYGSGEINCCCPVLAPP